MTDSSSLNRNLPGGPHLTPDQIQERLVELETAAGQRRIDLMTELAWRPAWAIRSRRGVVSALKEWWSANKTGKLG